MSDLPENLEPLPDPETPLTNLVDEEILGSAIDQDEEAAPESLETGRVGRSRRLAGDFIEGEDDEENLERDTSGTRQEQPILIRQQSSSRIPILPLAFGLIAAGVLLLARNFVDGLEISTASGLILVAGSVILTNIFRFFESGRRERGLFFIAMVLMVWGILLAMDVTSSGRFSLVEFWPLTIAAVGVSFVFTFMFERTHQTGLLFPGILLIFISGVAIAANEEIIGSGIQNAISNYALIFVALFGLILIPTALQGRR